MPDGNPIVEDAERRTTDEPLEGAGMAQDAADLVARVASGDWAEGLVSLVSAGLEVKGFVEDPLAKLSSMGLGWVVEHVGWLRWPLDFVASDQEKLTLMANAWTGIGDELRQAGQDLDNWYRTDSAHWAGPAVEQYRKFCGDRVHLYYAAADAASSVTTTVTICKGILAVVRGIIRDLVTDCVGKIISVIARYPPPATPAALPEVTTTAIETGNKITTWLTRLRTALANAGQLFKDGGNLFRNIRDYLAEARSAFDAARAGGVGLLGSLGHAASQTGSSVAFAVADAGKQVAEGVGEAAAEAVKELPAKAALEGAKEVAKSSSEAPLYEGGRHRVTGEL